MAGARAAGRPASAGSAGMEMTFWAAHLPSSPWCHSQIEADRSSTLTTTPTKPYSLVGSWAGRSSSAIWCSSPRSTVWMLVRVFMSQKCSRCPYLRPSSRSGTIPFSIIDGVPHSEVMATSSLMCHHTS